MVMRVLLTGATGFVGRAVLEKLVAQAGRQVVVAARRPISSAAAVSTVRIAGIDGSTDWREAVEGVDVVIHSAARVHVMNEAAADPLSEFRKVNVEGTLQLAREAARAGARRFVFVSSIKVNGEGTAPGRPYQADDEPAPADPYGISKQEAEQQLKALAVETGMEVVIIRPPLVYGPGVKANFLNMMRWLNKGVPLPLGSIDNRRSLVALDNLVDLIETCVAHPAAANQTFLVSDGEDLSTSELLRRMARALGKPARLLPVPMWLLESAAALLGKRAFSNRLCGSLQVDIGKTRSLLGWTPPVGVDEALRKVAKHFMDIESK
ncbi:SDR family oxidoreductase [Pseudomonas sp. BN102]|uniref:UDP-glucose 4-epimerase family protein n=1 Tax=Pseudomonas sp. BN102 TaxID=2567886 RepID=UPI002458C2DA|nr:SDR family oxidoreductase [Pseudomonas sp. BN102]MDH4607320.1 SDR family oxidoreductase [Pseudomonas sp. BN102]